MKYFGIVLSLATGLFLINQQAKGCYAPRGFDDTRSVILKFLQEVYETQDDALKIAHQYIGLDDLPNEFSTEKRYEVAAANITLMRKGEGVSSFSAPLNKKEIAALRVVPYTSLLGASDSKLLHFGLDNNQSQYLYVALKNNAVWKYFYVKNNKIYSFDYLVTFCWL